MNSLSDPRILLAKALEERKRRLLENAVERYRPYDKQREFHTAGIKYRERLLMAGNQLGKTLAAGAETAFHLTGRYPDWWLGRTFPKPTTFWVAGVTGEGTRDGAQRMLMGRVNAIGTGMLPKDAIVDYRKKSGVSEAVDFAIIKHGGGGDTQSGESYVAFKSYDQGREKFQAETLSGVWFDEEPPLDIYSEGFTRTNATKGLVYLTFTPLQGMSDVVMRFLEEESPSRHVTHMTIDDVDHYTADEKREITAGYPAHEREARAMGIPILGSGRVFPVPEADITVMPFVVPGSWPQICGIDFGWDHPSAAVRCAWDRDSDTWYVIAASRAREMTPMLFSGMVRPWGDWLPWAWPHDGLQHDKGSGIELAGQYRAQGLKMLKERATFDNGESGVEAGLMDMLTRMQTGRFKVFAHLNDWFSEFRLYHRKDGKIVKKNDDLMSATRYALMMKRYAVTKILAASWGSRSTFIGDTRVGY